MSTVFAFAVNVCSLPGVILVCSSEFYFAVTVVGHRTNHHMNIKVNFMNYIIILL